jgi:predicted ATPase
MAALYDAMNNAARDRGKRALAATLTHWSSRVQPTLLIVEDLHWADPQMLAHPRRWLRRSAMFRDCWS